MRVSRGGLVYAAVAGSFMLLLVWAERRWPLRKRIESSPVHTARNLALAGSSLAISQSLEGVVTPALFRLAETYQLGLLRRLPLPYPLRQAAGFLLLDYSLYWWHWLNHRIPFLWRGHLVHHVDVDMDASTGLRFHFWELVLTLALRCVQILVLGVDRQVLQIWNRSLLLAVVFQHSNLRLSEDLEAILGKVLVTPEAHALHHSQNQEEGQSNFSSMLIIWDRLHGTHLGHRLGTNGKIGVPDYPQPLGLENCLRLPFESHPSGWSSAARDAS